VLDYSMNYSELGNFQITSLQGFLFNIKLNILRFFQDFHCVI
jgi:hypothetical protein